jgi:hypothetical protein
MTDDANEIAAELRDGALIASGESLRRGCQNCGIAANLANTAADIIERQAAEIARLRSIIGDTVWCEACGAVVPLDGPPQCDCIEVGCPESQRLHAHDVKVHEAVAELRAEIARLKAQVADMRTVNAQTWRKATELAAGTAADFGAPDVAINTIRRLAPFLPPPPTDNPEDATDA